MTEDVKNRIIIDHIHPLKEDVISLKKTVEYHEKELKSVKSVLQSIDKKIDDHNKTMTEKVDRNTDLVNRLWYLSIGGIGVAGAVFAVVEWLVPLLPGVFQ